MFFRGKTKDKDQKSCKQLLLISHTSDREKLNIWSALDATLCSQHTLCLEYLLSFIKFGLVVLTLVFHGEFHLFNNAYFYSLTLK